LEAKITIEYDNSKLARSIADAVSADNSGSLNGLSIKTECKEKIVITRILCNGKFGTFVATVDDLLFSITIAERTLQETAWLRINEHL